MSECATLEPLAGQMELDGATKECRKCHAVLPLNTAHFRKRPDTCDGYEGVCIACRNSESAARKRERRARNNIETKKAPKAPNRPSPLEDDYPLRVRQDISTPTYANLVDDFGPDCCVCHKRPHGKMLVYVHTHSHKVVGLVCAVCDAVIFHLQENPGWLAAADEFHERAQKGELPDGV